MTRSRLLGGSAAFLFAGLGPRILLAPEGGDGGGGDPPAAGGDGKPAAGGAGDGTAPPAQAGAVTAYRPEGLPEHFAGKDDKETIDKLFTANKGFRDSQAKYEPPPADVNGYVFEWSDTVKPFAADLGEDKFFAGVKEDALAAGLGPKQAGAFLDKVMSRMITMDLVDKPVDVEAEKMKMAPADARGLAPAERDAAITRRVQTNTAFVDSFVARGFDAEAAKAVNAELAAFPELNQLVEFMRLGQNINPAPGGSAPTGTTRADVEKRMSDPRGRVGSPEYDADFARETDRMWKDLVPG